MKKLFIMLLSGAALVTSPAFAGTEAKSFKEKIVVPPVEECRFRDMEFQIDGYFAAVFGPKTSGATLNTGVGGGTGLNFFFAKYFGIGAEAFWYSNDGIAEHMIGGAAYFRYPICSLNLAPYVMVGGGAGFDGNPVGYGDVGGGLEYRFTNNIGLFTDARWYFGAPDNVAVLRSGVRFAF